MMPKWRAVLTRLSWVAIAVLAVVTPIELLVRAHDYPVRGEGSFVREVESGKPHITDPVIGYLTESELDLSRPGPITSARIDNSARRRIGAASIEKPAGQAIERLERKVENLQKALFAVGGAGLFLWLTGRQRA